MSSEIAELLDQWEDAALAARDKVDDDTWGRMKTLFNTVVDVLDGLSDYEVADLHPDDLEYLVELLSKNTIEK